MIVDVFLFNDEFSMLECRLYELDGLVDLHIAIEGNRTMAGAPKPYRLTHHIDERVMPVQVDLADVSMVTGTTHGMPGNYIDHWRRDWAQRDAATDALADFSDDDVVIYGDVDEIPRRAAVEQVVTTKSTAVMNQRLLIYSLDWTGGWTWKGSVIGRIGDLDGFPMVRKNRESYPPMNDGGWHLTWFGGRDEVVRKVMQFAHGEMGEDIPQLLAQYEAHRWPGDGRELDPYRGPYPRWVEDGYAPEGWR